LQGPNPNQTVRLIYVGSCYGLETKIVPRYPWIEFYTLCIRGITRPGQRSFWFFWAWLALAQLPLALCHALYITLKVRPNLIIGVGGYASFGPLLWGTLFRIPLFLHEQNFFPGVVTRLFAPLAQKVFLTYPQTARWLRARQLTVTGLPVRPEILSATPDPERFGLHPTEKTVLVFGGSRGSRVLTETVLATRQRVTGVQFLVITGDGEAVLNHDGARTVLVPYIHEMGTALATADLVIARAGAATLAELTALHKPAVIVPWPGAAGDHQMANAGALAQSNDYILLRESQLSPKVLAEAIREFLQRPTRCSQSYTVHSNPALSHILREIEVLLDAEPANSTTVFYRYRRRWHERFGESLP
jgi:UDP-N-acetylglucosamine--N-acetylmuramyl-(pentapeptide) pyrophosphoryl-undecaprenol N-acetylglucosamine transferase